VVLNKIDTLWDALDSDEVVQAQLDKQMCDSAQILGVNREQVLALSAQKGLLGKLTGDGALLNRSRLAVFEDALSQGIVGRRRQLLGHLVGQGITRLRSETARAIQIRRHEITEQSIELKSLQGKNRPVIRNMRARIAAEQADFEAAGIKIHAVRSVHLKLLREIFGLLGSSHLNQEMVVLVTALNQKGFKLGVKRAYAETFERLRANLQQVHARGLEIHAMFVATFSQLNTDYGFSLHAPDEPDVVHYHRELVLDRAQPPAVSGCCQHTQVGTARVCPEAGQGTVNPFARRLRIGVG
jgi:hypothetical protein